MESEGLQLGIMGNSFHKVMDVREVRELVCFSEHIGQPSLHFPFIGDTHFHVLQKLWQALGVRGENGWMTYRSRYKKYKSFLGIGMYKKHIYLILMVFGA